MSSSGIRLGACDYSKCGHIRPIEKGSELVAAKIILYAEVDEEYFSFMSKEVYLALRKWVKYPADLGKLIDDNSWLMRELWYTQNDHGKGINKTPEKLVVLIPHIVDILAS
jgi:hypothetical protein